MQSKLTSLAGASALLLLTACSGGGGGSSTPAASATTLVYTNPTGSGYLLLQDAASSGNTLVLDVVGPATPAAISGISFSFTASNITWTTPFVDGGTFNLGSAPLGLVSKVTSNELQGALAQKGTASPVSASNSTVLAKITMKLNSGVAPGTLAFADSGKSAVLNSGGVSSIAIAVGTLKAQ